MIDKPQFTPDNITTLGPGEVFVFGSNLAGHHGGGAANYAHRHFGAEWGVGEGLRGQSYAIPTMFATAEDIKPYVDKFTDFARDHGELLFLVTPIGCGIAGWRPADIAPFFRDARLLPNVVLPRSFVDILGPVCPPMPTWDVQSFCNRMAHCRYGMAAGSREAFDFLKELRKEVYANTVSIVGRGRYVGGELPDTCPVRLDDDAAMMADTVFVDKPFSVTAVPARSMPTSFNVVNEDCLDVAASHVREGYLPAVLNFASRQNPGGGVTKGSGAQEESIFRRTDAFRSLYQFVDRDSLRQLLAPSGQDGIVGSRPERYPMERDFGGIYTPGVTVFRQNEAKGYGLLAEPFKVGLVTVAAINHPQCVDPTHMTPDCVQGTLNKLRTVLRLALRAGHDSLVLGAFGCGVYDNPATQMAQLFRQVFDEAEFKNKFRLVTFAVLDNGKTTPRNPVGLYQAFANVFGRRD